MSNSKILVTTLKFHFHWYEKVEKLSGKIKYFTVLLNVLFKDTFTGKQIPNCFHALKNLY